MIAIATIKHSVVARHQRPDGTPSDPDPTPCVYCISSLPARPAVRLHRDRPCIPGRLRPNARHARNRYAQRLGRGPSRIRQPHHRREVQARVRDAAGRGRGVGLGADRVAGAAFPTGRPDRAGRADVELRLSVQAQAADRPASQRNMLFTFDGQSYGPLLNIPRALLVCARGQSHDPGAGAGSPASSTGRLSGVLAEVHRRGRGPPCHGRTPGTPARRKPSSGPRRRRSKWPGISSAAGAHLGLPNNPPAARPAWPGSG